MAIKDVTEVGGSQAVVPVTKTAGGEATALVVVPVTEGGGSISNTEYNEDAAAAANPTGPVLILVRRDTLSASEVSADGDYVAAKATNKGELHTANLRLETIFGEVSASPTANTVLARLKTIAEAVDGLEGFTDGLEGFVDGIETLITSTNSLMTTQAGYLDGLETLATSLNGYVDGLEGKLPTGAQAASASLGVTLSTENVALFPASLGTKAAAASFAVTLSTENAALLDGLEGSLTTIIGHVDGIEGKLPTGTQLAAASLGVTLASDDPAVVALQVIDDWDESDRCKVNPIAGQAGVAAGAGAVGATVQRMTLASDDPAVASLSVLDDWDESDRLKANIIVGQAGVTGGAGAIAANTPRITPAAYQFETVAASQTDSMLGSTGAVGDYLDGLLIVPATTSPGEVSIEYGSTNIIVFAGGASSVSNLIPFFIPIGLVTPSGGGWEVSTGANVSVIARGVFT